MPFQIRLTDQFSAAALLKNHPDLLFPYFPKLVKPFESLPLICIVALEEKNIVGLTVAVQYEKEEIPTVKLLSIFVNEEFRKKGLAKNMLKVLEMEAAKKSVKRIFAEYQSNWKNTLVMEHIFNALYWSEKKEIFKLYKVDLEKASKNSPLNNFLHELPQNVAILPISKISERDKQQMLTINFPEQLNPFQLLDRIAENSMVVKTNGKITGWLMTHKTEKSIQWTSLFISPQPLKGLIAFHLIRETGRMQLEMGFNECLFMISTGNVEMLKIFKKRFAEYSYFEHTLNYIEKNILK